MQTYQLIDEFLTDLVAIRRDLHAHPEIGFQEHRTSEIVATNLASWGIEVHRGIGGTGVVGVLKGRLGDGPTVGLRADMDALPIEEKTQLEYSSKYDGVFHGCGHDGHTAILLGTARYVANTRNFSGTVVFIFQPAEEGLGGARAMLKDGLFDRFPCERLYGLHNWPELEAGKIAVVPGICMAGADFFDIDLRGKGGHGAMPHQSRDPVTVAAHLISALQIVVSRFTDPLDSAVLSVTRMHGGSTYNIIPSEVTLAGTLRFFSEQVHLSAVEQIKNIVKGCATAFDVSADVKFKHIFNVTRNDTAACEEVIKVANQIVGETGVVKGTLPSMSSEDFSEMLDVVPGAYVFLGQSGTKPLHHPEFFFDDKIIPLGATLLAKLVEDYTSQSSLS